MTFSRCALEMIRRLRSPRPWLSIVLALALAFSPLATVTTVVPVGLVTPAQAGPKEDLQACLNFVKTAGATVDAILAAVANPEFLLCASEATSMNFVTIAFMAAMTALWVADPKLFNNPEECKVAVVKELVQVMAGALDVAIKETGGIVDSILTGIIGGDGVKMIHDIAAWAGGQEGADAGKKALLDEMVKQLASALGPVMHYVNCGCAAAGTAAILKNAAEGIAGAANACGSVITDPGAVIKAFLDDPVGTLKLVGEAICEGVAEVADVCTYAKELYAAGNAVMEAICVIPGGCDAVGKAYEEVKCWFSDCKPPYQEGPSPPGPCPENQFIAIGLTYDCICSPPNGKAVGSKDMNLGSGMMSHDGFTCQDCGFGRGRNDAGYCQICNIGFTHGTGGTCDTLYSCGTEERYRSDNSGCFSCPAGSTFNNDNSGCWPICTGSTFNPTHNACAPVCSTWTTYNSGTNTCDCPPGMVDHNQRCEIKVACSPAKGEQWDPVTNTCGPKCDDPDSINKKIGGGDIAHWECVPCGEGQTSVNNVCEIKCGADQIVIGGSCGTCPEGTTAGENNSCVPACAPGSAPKTAPAKVAQNIDWGKSFEVTLVQSSFNKNLSVATPLGGGTARNARAGNAGSGQDATVLADNQCKKCDENEYSVTKTKAGDGYKVTRSECVACPAGEVSNRGSASCHKPLYFLVTPGLTLAKTGTGMPAASVPDKYFPNTLQTEPPPEQRRPGGKAATKTDGPLCPEGQVMTTNAGCQPAKTGTGQTVKAKPPNNSAREPRIKTGPDYKATVSPGIKTGSGYKATVSPGIKTGSDYKTTVSPGIKTTPGSGTTFVTPGIKTTPGPVMRTAPPPPPPPPPRSGGKP